MGIIALDMNDLAGLQMGPLNIGSLQQITTISWVKSVNYFALLGMMDLLRGVCSYL